MCGEVACALSASGLSHFSITTKVSGPNLAWKFPMPSASIAGPYSMQPFSAWTASMLGAELLEDRFAHTGFGGDDGDDVDHAFSFRSGDAFKDAVVPAGRERADLRCPIAKAAGLFPGRALEHIGRIQ